MGFERGARVLVEEQPGTVQEWIPRGKGRDLAVLLDTGGRLVVPASQVTAYKEPDPFKPGDYVLLRARVQHAYRIGEGPNREAYALSLSGDGQHLLTSVKNVETDKERQKAADRRSRKMNRDKDEEPEENLAERETPQESTTRTENLRVPQGPPTDATEDEDKVDTEGNPIKRRGAAERKK